MWEFVVAIVGEQDFLGVLDLSGENGEGRCLRCSYVNNGITSMTCTSEIQDTHVRIILTFAFS